MYGESVRTDRRQIFNRFAREAFLIITRLRSALANHAAGEMAQAELELREAFLRLNDRWNAYCRRLLLASALGGSGFDGDCVGATGISAPQDLMDKLGIAVPWKNDKPWHVSDVLLGAAKKVGVKNLATLNGAIGSTPNPSENIRYVRNYFAHANPHTFMKAEFACNMRDPIEFCFKDRTSGEATVIVWIQDLLSIARAAAA